MTDRSRCRCASRNLQGRRPDPSVRSASVAADREHVEDDRLYRAIGEYVVKFETVIGMAALGIQLILDERGLQGRRLSAIAVAKLTADPILDMFFSMAAEVGEGWTNQDRKVVSGLRKRASAMVERRNEIVHSQWVVGWLHPSDEEERRYPASRYWRDASGFKFRSLTYSPLEVERLAAEAQLVGVDIVTFGVAVLEHKRPIEIAEQIAR
jgi:hypothetical protein